MKDGKIDGDEVKKYIKYRTLDDMEGSKIDYSKLVYRSGNNECIDFTRFGSLSSVYWKLVTGKVVKLKLKEFKNEIV